MGYERLDLAVRISLGRFGVPVLQSYLAECEFASTLFVRRCGKSLICIGDKVIHMRPIDLGEQLAAAIEVLAARCGMSDRTNKTRATTAT